VVARGGRVAELTWGVEPLLSTVGMAQRGHSDETIRKILGENTLQVARVNWSAVPIG
jgi:hypothetical protein